MKIGVIRYPGSNCYNDTINYFGINNCIELWHTNKDICKDIDLLIIPGGFAFGDRIYEKATGKFNYSPGEMAVQAPITSTILYCHDNNIPILGICNGFQILIQLGLLEGKLIKNDSDLFNSKLVDLIFNDNFENVKFKMYIANYYGNYQNENINESNTFLKYDNFNNGSIHNIAGIKNDNNTVFGMMPHPERMKDKTFKGYLFNMLFQKNIIKNKINNLLNSEHISYKSTIQYLRGLNSTGDHVIQGPGENAGIIDIGEGYGISIRIESHNHPTYKNAFEGAATGVGGIIRDIICMGSKPIALLDFLRFGYDDNSSSLLNEAIKGIAYYGNTIGIPNVGGSLHKSDIYNKNPLVNVACIGLVKKENIIYGNALNEGSLLILCGAKTGNEGVDSAVMASKQLNEEKENNIQKADAYLENLLLDAFTEISDANVAEGCQDLGAGGILCATTEVIKRGREKTNQNLGCNIYLHNVPLKGKLDNYSIIASETQERMLIVSKENNLQTIQNILKKWDLEFNTIGKVTNNGSYNVYNNDTLIYSEDFNNFNIKDNIIDLKYNTTNHEINKIKDMSLWETYDHSIGSRTIKGPDIPEHFAVLDIPEVNKHLYITWGNNVQDTANKLKEFNITPLGLVNCLNFGDPLSCLGDFKNSIDEINEASKKLNIPILGGNVSMYNSTNNIDIPPSIVIVMVGTKDYINKL